jgi:lysophospholipase L1-like esterase
VRGVLFAIILAGSLAVAGCSGPATGHLLSVRHRVAPVSFYLALGDSLSQGVQPNSSGTSVSTDYGYADQLYAWLRRGDPGLRLVKLGCSDETTSTMINGGICSYRAGSQLATAVRFLRAQRSRVSLVTLDIGANDPDSCITKPELAGIASCVADSIRQTATNLSHIMSRLRAADPKVRIIAMNYYLPALAEWRLGIVGHAFARVSELAALAYNTMLTDIYQSYGVRIADVFGAFHTADFNDQVTVPGFGSLPRNVAEICLWTWECASAPRGPNEHANRTGYAEIARTFLAADS